MQKIFLIAAAVMLSGCAAALHEEQSAYADSLSMEHFRDTADVADDKLDTFATITTLKGFQEKSVLGVVGTDHFLRAFVSKSGGPTKYMLYQTIYYDGGWRFYVRANYETPTGPKQTDAVEIKRDVVGCYRRGCTYNEHVGIVLDEDLLRWIATRTTAPQVDSAWAYKFVSKSGTDFPSWLLRAEAAGLLARVDQYKAQLTSTSSR